LATGTRTSSKITCAVGLAFQPSFFSGAPKETPGVSFSTTRQEMPPPCSPGADHDEVDIVHPAARNELLGAVEHIVIAIGRALVRSAAASDPNPARSGNSWPDAPC
jgi:hypothetical protein